MLTDLFCYHLKILSCTIKSIYCEIQKKLNGIFLIALHHSMARADLDKSNELVTNTTTASKYIPRCPRICINWNPLFQTSLHKIFKNCFLWSKSCLAMFTFREVLLLSKFGLKGGILIDAHSETLRYVLLCCGSKYISYIWQIFCQQCNVGCQSNHFCKTYNKAKSYEKSRIFNLW